MTLGRVARAAASAAALTALACGERAEPIRTDTATDSAIFSQAAAGAPEEWASELGLLLVVPSDTSSAAVVIYPDFPSPRLVASAPLTLIGVTGDTAVTRARLVATESEQCGGAPLIELTDAVSRPWSIGLLRTTTTPLHMDSIEALASADSTRLAADLAAAGSALTVEDETPFKGLPFTVLGAHRLSVDSVDVVAAHVVRRLPQEASPLEEHLFFILERRKGAPRAAWTTAYAQRSEGTEDTAEHFSVLAAARSGTRTLLVLARDQLERTRFEVLERAADGTWRSRWSRTLVC